MSMQHNHSASLLTTPVLFLVFNRPSATRQVFKAIRREKPRQLFVAADGSRDTMPGEWAVCDEVKRIATAVDWDCDVRTLFRDKNLGCGKAVSEAISWFFSEVEEGIILEDDCLPSPDFFRFCTELLEYYRHDTRIMQIGGNNLYGAESPAGEYSYFFSNHNYIWGWATWRRAWQRYDYGMKHYEEITRKGYHHGYFGSFDEEDYFNYVFNQTYKNKNTPGTWDYQWQFTRMLHAGLAVVPSRNLVVNIGIGNDATHTVSDKGVISNLVHEHMHFPLRHPEFMMVARDHDSRIFSRLFTTPWSRIKRRIKSLIPKQILSSANNLLG